MGIILTKFRKKKTTAEILEEIQRRIDELEKYTFNTREQKKRCVGNFVSVSVGVYVLAFGIFYFLYSPSTTWRKQMVYTIPLFTFPFVIIVLRYIFTYYFERKLNKNSRKLVALKAEKKKILEEVMDKETYKVAVSLLVRFGDPRPKIGSINTSNAQSSQITNRSMNTSTMSLPRTPSQMARTDSLKSDQTSAISSRPSWLTVPSATSTPQSKSVNNSQSLRPISSLPIVPQPLNATLKRRTIFPIINPNERSVFERILDMLMGDGPQNRYAMICKNCYGHNGMALKEDFEYTTFRCVYCDTMNVARKSRPKAPTLQTNHSRAHNYSNDSNSSSSESMDSEKTTNSSVKNNLNNEKPKETELNSDQESAKILAVGKSEDSVSQYSDDDGLRDLLEKEQVTEQKLILESLPRENLELFTEKIILHDVNLDSPNVSTA